MGCLEYWRGHVISVGLAASLGKNAGSCLNYPPSPGCVLPEIFYLLFVEEKSPSFPCITISLQMLTQ